MQENKVTVLRSRVAGGYGYCDLCGQVTNAASYAIYDAVRVMYSASCAMHLAELVDKTIADSR